MSEPSEIETALEADLAKSVQILAEPENGFDAYFSATDWEFYIPRHLRMLWSSLSPESRMASCIVALHAASLAK